MLYIGGTVEVIEVSFRSLLTAKCPKCGSPPDMAGSLIQWFRCGLGVDPKGIHYLRCYGRPFGSKVRGK